MKLIEELRKKVEGVDVLVTHPGASHRDDFLVTCMMIYLCRVTVYRREPNYKDIQDPWIMVVDVGGQHNPDTLLFDHHHLDNREICALHMFLDYLGILDKMREVFSWVDVTAWLDADGPYLTAQRLGISPKVLFQLTSPIEVAILDEFGRRRRLLAGDSLYEIMHIIGQANLEYIEKYSERLAWLKENAIIEQIDEDIRAIVIKDPKLSEPGLAMGAYRASIPRRGDIAVSVTPDARGSGRTVYRFADHKRIDMSRVEGDPRTLFVHKGGFILKTKPNIKLKDVYELIRMSIIPKGSHE